MRADRRWSRQLLKGALQMAVDALARGAAGVGANGIMIRNLHPAAVNAFGHGHRAFRTGAVENNYAHMAPMHGVAIETP
jgi:hypothetical protein